MSKEYFEFNLVTNQSETRKVVTYDDYCNLNELIGAFITFLLGCGYHEGSIERYIQHELIEHECSDKEILIKHEDVDWEEEDV